MSSQRKVNILGIKSDHERAENLMKNFCEYMWEHDYCNEIRVSLIHHSFNGELTVDQELEKQLKAVGLRWVSINHSSDVRMTIYAIKRPLNIVAHKSSKRTQAYPVLIEHLTILSLKENNEKKHMNTCFTSLLSLIKHVEGVSKENYDEICQRDEFSHHLNCIKQIEDFMKKEAIREGIN